MLIYLRSLAQCVKTAAHFRKRLPKGDAFCVLNALYAPRVVQVKTIRRALKLSQEEFAASFHIPIGTLRDWEQGRKEPDAAARAYLRVIAREPEVVRRALDRRQA
jgi:DNA-binding transcriptional regulator YiaG